MAIQFASLLMWNQHSFTQPLTWEMKITLLRMWLRVPGKVFYALGNVQITLLLHRMDPIFLELDPPALRIRLKPWFYLFKDKYPFGVRLWKNPCYVLPAPKLIGEDTEAFTWYEEYYDEVIQGTPGALESLCGLLIRRKGRYLDEDDATKTQELLKPNPVLKFYCYWWYSSQRRKLIDRYPSAFGKGGGKKTNGPDFTSQYKWRKVIYVIAEKGPWRDKHQLKKDDVHNFLDYLSYHSDYMKELDWKERLTKPNGTT